ncbi:MAG: hypothetical protein HY348_06995 [Nitrospira defluvii]|nr:hypothetical protein [Nitrospira defluvii]
MNVRLVFVLFPLLFLGAPVHAQTPCADCLNAADAEARKCFGNAISADDKVACLENREAQAKACRNRECQIEREESVTNNVQPTPSRPGHALYIPTEGEWLAVTMRAGLRREASPDHPFSLDIILVDPETLQIVVRYQPTVNRESMNRTIAAAREAIRSTAGSYGWDKWVKIRETVEMYPAKK